LLHAAHCALTRWCDHVVAIGSCTIANQLTVNFRSACERVLQLFDYQTSAAASDDESIALCVVGAGRFFRGFIIFGGKGAHGVKEAGQSPMLFLATASKNNILLAQLNLFHGAADTMRAGGAGRRNGVVNTFDFKGGCETGRSS